MTDQPDHKTCLACRQPFTRRPSPHDSAFRWMRRKYCGVQCARRAKSGIFRPGPAARERIER